MKPMHIRKSPHVQVLARTCAIWLAIIAAAVVVPAAGAQQIVSGNASAVSVSASGVPLQKVLEQFTQVVELKLWVKQDVGERIVTIELGAMPVATALRRVLLAAEVDFVMSGDAASPPIRLVVGDSKGSAPAAAANVPEAPASEEVKQLEEAAAREKEDAELERARQAEDTAVGAEPDPAIPATAERLVQLLAPAPRRPLPVGAPIALPFPAPDGQPYTVQNYRPAPGVVQLPFPDPTTGQPLELVVPPAKPGVVTLPFPGPDGQPITIPVATPRAPNRPPGNR